ncbi:ATPase [Alloscardovia theropitheci]|uniref:Sensor-like histidine kinase SenX3 n=1 Tax=Alloscardovia theropitheci TaxID=2496842 RepID=A0A4R0QPC7_9BIFI|nr:ATP-binding protein [Alloscardovia theropitheci]TCD54073.1 ATPase [Alloscardovia theropitheci]
MQFDVTSVVSLIIIIVMTVIFVGWILSFLWRLISPVIAHNKSFWRTMKSMQWRMKYRRRRRIRQRLDVDDDDDDDDDDELDLTTIRVLSQLEAATIVVSADDEVERASASAYRWNIVDNDEIINEEILDAIHRVRQGQGRQSFDIVTHTATVIDEDNEFGDEIGNTASSDSSQIRDNDKFATKTVERPHWLAVSVSAISDHMILVLIRDNSEQKRFAQTRDDFVVNVAEQLIKPTQQMEAIGNRWKNFTSAEAISRDGKIIATQAGHLNKLVSDLLLLIQAQEKVMPSPENRLDLGELVISVISDIKPYRGVRIHTRCAQNIMVNASAVQIRAAVDKLVANAIHYSNDNAVVTVVVDKAHDDKFAVIRVIDTGVGIPQDEQSHIFERFYRGSQQPYDSDDSVGLGLSIVKHVALTHHGTVTVWSAPGKGSTFSLFLPLAQ